MSVNRVVDIRALTGSRRIDTSSLAQDFGLDAEFIRQRLGLDSRGMLESVESLSDLAARSLEQLLDENGSQGASRDNMVVCFVSQTPDRQIPPLSSEVAFKLKLPKGSLLLDLSAGCSGFPLGLCTLDAVMTTTGRQFGVLVTADAYSRIVNPRDRNTSGMFGDGASATLMSPQGRYGIGIGDFGTRADMRESLIWRGSGTWSEGADSLIMNGRGILEFVVSEVPPSVNRCLSLNHLEKDQVDLFVFHQANLYVIQELRRLLALEPERAPFGARDTGNTTSSSIPMVLEERVFRAGSQPSTMVLSGFGVGLSWATICLLENL